MTARPTPIQIHSIFEDGKGAGGCGIGVMEGIAVGMAVAIGVPEVGDDAAGVGEGVTGVGEGVIGVEVAVLVGVGVDCVTTWTGGPTILGRSNTLASTRISTEGS